MAFGSRGALTLALALALAVSMCVGFLVFQVLGRTATDEKGTRSSLVEHPLRHVQGDDVGTTTACEGTTGGWSTREELDRDKYSKRGVGRGSDPIHN
ncbi:hypothetical protein MLD38_016996 [Melastoma candidum]|uniref:Uncharacterized protein n=1 Tax=Melastoma candidum TaxID=119954 RepID=A0ACB9QP77_9MYRT|nr:hypothetical protein MLD38_016996 [Melastoma candidum]